MVGTLRFAHPTRPRSLASGMLRHRHDDLAEMLVGLHVLECLVDVIEGKHLVDRQLQFSRLDRAPDVLLDLVEDLADFRDGAGAEGDADIVDAAGRVQVEVAIGVGAAARAQWKWAWGPPSRPALTMRPFTFVAARFWLATLPETWSTMRSTPSPFVAFSTSSTHEGSGEAPARSAPYSFSRPRRVASVEEPITSLAPLSFAICIAIRPTPELAPWISTACPGCTPPMVTTALCMVASATGRGAASSKFMFEGARNSRP